MTPAAFSLRNIHKDYRAGDRQIAILQEISLTIPSGQYTAIVGPSGSGKSTLMQLLGCLDVPTSGSLAVLGQEISALSDDDLSALRCRALGFIFQGFNLLPYYDAVSNVALAMAYGGQHYRREKAERILTDLGLQHRLHARPNTLSGGEKQRVAIGRAIANDPSILLADEPTGALDSAAGLSVLDMFDGLHRQGKTIIVVTHDRDVAQRAERIIEIRDGRVRSDSLT